jgi:RNA polymerase sigma-70 factor (ECF subfamily)
MSELRPDSEITCKLLNRIQAGDLQAREEIFQRHRIELRRFIQRHLDPQLRNRFDPSDVVQDTHAELARRLDDFLLRRPMPFHLWQRKQAYERLLNLRRDHVYRRRRSVQREVPRVDRSALLLARPLLSPEKAPHDALEAKERAEKVRDALTQLSREDREILLLRHVDDLPFDEAACLLGITAAAARKRFGRALIRMRELLAAAGLL